MATQDATVNVGVKVDPVAVNPAVPHGLSTYLGVIVSIVSYAAAIYAALKSNDTAAITAAATGLTTTLATISSRTAQAVAQIKTVAPAVAAVVSGVQNAVLTDPEAEAVGDDDLPTDEEEFQGTPPDAPAEDLSEVRGTPLGLQDPQA